MCKEAGYNFISLIVDHKYRKNSTSEAKKVQKLLAKHSIKSVILTYTGKKPSKNIENYLRNLRYNLLINYCKDNKINYILTAHHLDDNIETLLMKLSDGASFEGLAGIAEEIIFDGVKIYRPVLNYTKQQLTTYLVSKNIKWFEDETNKDEKFLRNKLRKILSGVENYEVIQKNLSRTIASLKEVSNYINLQQSKFFEENFTINKFGFVEVDKKIFNDRNNNFVLSRILYYLYNQLKFNNKSIRYDEVQNALNFIISGKKSFTLVGVECFVDGEKIYFFKELSKMQELELTSFKNKSPLKQGVKLIWSRNFSITINQLNSVSKLIPSGKFYAKHYKKYFPKIPNKILKTFPVIIDIEKNIILPHINCKGANNFSYIFSI
jgi:tRNA(Ile)-lysidine synthase